MAAKKPQGIPLHWLVRQDRALPEHRRKLNRKARESAMNTKGTISVADAIEDEYLRLADADERYRGTQREKARKAPVGDDGRTTKQVVADVVKGHPIEAKPDDLLPHVRAALDENGNKPIADKWAKALIGREQRARKRASAGLG